MNINYMYAFVNKLISASDFEKWVYDNYRQIGNEQLARELLSCDYNSENDIKHIMHLINEAYCIELQKINVSDLDAELVGIIESRDALPKMIKIDCSEIGTSGELHYLLKKAFRFPDRYGMNRDAFNDIIDLSNVNEIRIIGYENLRKVLPHGAENLIKLLNANKNENCPCPVYPGELSEALEEQALPPDFTKY